jgi:hypothetical protein
VTKTYGEKRQEAYFRAAIELYRLVVEIAEENIDNPPEGRENVSEANLTWAASLVETTFAKAYDLEDKGHAETITSVRWENRLARERESARTRTAEGRKLKADILAKLAEPC